MSKCKNVNHHLSNDKLKYNQKTPHPDKCLVNEQTAHSYIMIPLSPTARFKQAVKKRTWCTLKAFVHPTKQEKKKKTEQRGHFIILFLTFVHSHILISKLVPF